MVKNMKKRRQHNHKNVPDVPVGKLIRKNAYVMKSKKKIFLKVSPSAINEYINRIIDGIQNNMPQIAETVYHKGRKTIMVKYKKDEPVYDDITDFFGKKTSRLIYGEGKHEDKK